MRVLFTKIGTFLLLAVLVVFYGCGQSADKKKEQIKPIPVATPAPTAVNDGLTPVDFTIPAGTNFVTAGTGTRSESSETLTVNVPENDSVKKVYFYWQRKNVNSESPSPSIRINGRDYTGKIVGGPEVTPDSLVKNAAFTFRADLTDSIDIGSGATTLQVRDKPSGGAIPNGATIVVFYKSAQKFDLSLFDGVDFFWAELKDLKDKKFSELAKSDPITFNFPAATTKRTAELTLLIGDEGEGSNSLKIQVGKVTNTTKIANPKPFEHQHGLHWDNYTKSIDIPAGVTKVRVFPISGPGDNPASLIWSMAGLSVPASQ